MKDNYGNGMRIWPFPPQVQPLERSGTCGFIQDRNERLLMESSTIPQSLILSLYHMLSLNDFLKTRSRGTAIPSCLYEMWHEGQDMENLTQTLDFIAFGIVDISSSLSCCAGKEEM